MNQKSESTFETNIYFLSGMDVIEQLNHLSRGEIQFTEQEIDAIIERYLKTKRWIVVYVLTCLVILFSLVAITHYNESMDPNWIIGFLVATLISLLIIVAKFDLEDTCVAVCVHWKVVKHWKIVLNLFSRRYYRVNEVWRSRGTLEKTKGEEVGVYALADYVDAMTAAGVQGRGLLRGINHSRFLSLSKHYLLPIEHPGADRLHEALLQWQKGLK